MTAAEDDPLVLRGAKLIIVARTAALGAYAPYSNFRVGAVVRVGEKIYKGCNVENASYGLTICAERNAIFAAIADGNKHIDELALSCIDATPSAKPNLRMPCGACRQVIVEFSTADTRIFVDGVGEFQIEELLPNGFDLK